MLILSTLILTAFAAVEASSSILPHTVLASARGGHKTPIIRLPTSLKPVEYTLSLVPDIAENATFDGHVEILFKVVTSTNKITLHKRWLNVTSVVVRGLGKGEPEIKVTGTREDVERNFYVITLEKGLEEERDYWVVMDYIGFMRADGLGLYSQNYHKENPEDKRRFVATQLQPLEARTMFPCFDEPALKAVFKIKVSRPGNMTALSNMPPLGPPTKHVDTPDGIGRYWDEFKPTPVMSPYLVAIFVSDFKHSADMDSKLRLFTRASADINQLAYCLRMAPKIAKALRKYTGIEDVMPKVDMVAVPEFLYEAMENWGLILIRDSLMLVDEGVATLEQKATNAYLIAHEFAHYWFGNLVTLDWWDNIWLNEGFATYMAYIAMGKVEKSWRTDEIFVVEKLLTSMDDDASAQSRPITSPVETHEQVDANMDDLSYAKGGSIVRMMNYMFAPPVFHAGIREYLKSRSFNTTNPDILFSILGRKFRGRNLDENVDFATIMKSWTTQMGFPVVTITRDYDNSSASITQKRFLLEKNETAARGYKWFIPLTYVSQKVPDFGDTKPAEWLVPETPELVLHRMPAKADEWLLFNVLHIGYYRVNYDAKNWDLLAAYLDSDEFETIPPLNRAQLIIDSFSLATAGDASHCVPLSLVRYIKRETDYIPLFVACMQLRLIDWKLQSLKDAVYSEMYIRDLLTPVYAKLSLRVKDTDDHITVRARAKVSKWACQYNVTQCSSDAVEMFRSFQFSSEPINPNVRFTVYCTALRENDREVRPYLDKQLDNPALSPTEKSFIFNVFTCFKFANVRARYIDKSLTIHLTSFQGRKHWIDPLQSKSIELDDLIVDYFIEHNTKIRKTLGPSRSFKEALSQYIPSISSENQVAKLKKFMGTLKKSQTLERAAIQTSIDKYMRVLSWRQVHGPLYIAWMKAEVLGSKEERDCKIPPPFLHVKKRPYTDAGSSRTPSLFVLYTLMSVLFLSHWY